MNRIKQLTVGLFAGLLVACGGGGGGGSGNGGSNPGPVTLPTNTAPVAEAGANQTVEVGNNVTLIGSGTDADNDSLTYLWNIDSQPTQSALSLNNPTQSNTSFTPVVAGTYQLSLIVSDGQDSSVADSLIITVTESTTPVNNRPIANAGGAVSGEVGRQVVLDGRGSSDPDGDPLVYSWSIVTQPAGASVSLVSTASDITGFTPDIAGTYVVQLIVNDTVNISEASTAEITVILANVDPVAVIAEIVNPLVNDTIQFDGTGSNDPDGEVGDSLQFTWALTALPDGSQAQLSASTTSNPSFQPDLVGTYAITLTVVDPRQGSASTTKSFAVTRVNRIPTADAGNIQSGLVGSEFTLNGTQSSDLDGDPLSYLWSVVTQPVGANVVINETASAVTQVILNEAGEYTFGLVVSDGEASSPQAEVSILVADNNAVPVADAGEDRNVLVGDSVTLSAENSSDADFDTLSYSWSIVSQPAQSNITLAQADNVQQTITVTHIGDYVLSVIVNDGEDDSAPASVTVSVTEQNAAPIAQVGNNVNVEVGTSVQLDGSASSDANNDTLTYIWQLINQPADSLATLSGANQVVSEFTPDAEGSYVVQLIVNDGEVNSLADTVTITAVIGNVAPTADAGADQNGRTGNTITLEGSLSTDADGDVLTYQWQFVSLPTGSNSNIQASDQVQATFIPDIAGDYVVSLRVSDGVVESAVDTVVISISNDNAVPIAVISGDFNRFTRQVITLSGLSSSDADGDALSFAWNLVSSPAGSTAELINFQTPNASFLADRVGNYVISLTVNDGEATSELVEQTISVTPHIVLERFIDGLPASYQAIDFPLDYFATVVGFLGTALEGFYTLDQYRITAMDQNYTIENLQFGFTAPGIIPFAFYEDGSDTPMANGDILEVGVPRVFTLGAPLTGGNIVDVVIRFRIAETGEIFTTTYRYSTTI